MHCYVQKTPFKLKKSIKLDGKRDEAIWSNLESFNQFHNHFPIDSGFVKKPVMAKAFHDGNSLYIGVTVFEDSPEYIVRSLKRDEGYDSLINSNN